MDTQKLKTFLNKYGHFLWIAALVFIIITLCSKCSFLFAFNDWSDSNCFFTVGKAMAEGQVLYRDIYEQKGLYLYVMHELAYLVSNDSFIFVYIYELIFGCLFGYAVYRLMLLYIDKKQALIALPVMLFVSYASICFCHGDSAEEFIMPLMAFSMLYMFEYAKGQKLQLYKYALSGAFAAFAFWIKFTLCGFFIGWILLAFIFEIRDKNVKRAFLGVAVFGITMLLASVPVFIYFGANGAIGDMFKSYIYNNMFVYTGEDRNFFLKIGLAIWGYIISIGYGWLFYIFIISGFVYIAVSKQFTRREKVTLYVLYAVTSFFIFCGGRRSKYYGLPNCIFAFTGAVALFKLKFTQKIWDRLLKRLYLAAGITVVVSAGLSLALSTNTPMMFKKKSDWAQYKIAAEINKVPDATLLNYGTLDIGVYTTANIVPTCKYFCGLNIPLEELTATQNQWVEEGRTDFVVSVAPPENIDIHYELKLTATQKYEGKKVTYYLYGLRGL